MGKSLVKQNVRELSLLLLIVFLAIVANLRSGGSFLTLKNIGDMFAETSILMILTMGMMIAILTGGIDLSVGSNMALSGMIACTILKANLGMPPVLVVVIAVATGLGVGLVNGFLISVLNIVPMICTIGTMNIYRGITYLVSGGSWILQQDMSRGFMNIATGTFLGLNNMVWIALGVVLLNFYFLNYNRTGRQVYAIGNSVSAARVSGIPVKRVQLLTYGLVGAAAGLSGILYVCKYAAAQGETALGYEMNVIASCVLGGVAISGGVGKVHGAALGAILFGMLSNALPLMRVSPFWQEAVRGLVILVSILINALIARRANAKALERRVTA